MSRGSLILIMAGASWLAVAAPDDDIAQEVILE